MAKGWDDFYRKYQRVYDKLQSADSMTEIGKFAAEKISTRTRLGYGVESTGGTKAKLEALTPEYIRSRKNFPGLSSETRATKSNLTRTGQLLDSVGVLSAGNGKASISALGTRDDGKTNRDIAKFQADGIMRKTTKEHSAGLVKRPFLNFSEAEVKQIQNFIRKIASQLLSGTS